MPLLRQAGPDVLLTVHVQPRAARDEVAGRRGEALHLRLTAPPVGGAANAACLTLLAQLLAVPKARLRLVAGPRSRAKVIRIAEATVAEVAARLTPHL
jgi:uncharacterized protein (TIGR00251 family)